MIRTNEQPRPTTPKPPIPTDVNALLRELENCFQTARKAPSKATTKEALRFFAGKK